MFIGGYVRQGRDGRGVSKVFLVRSCADAMPNSMSEWNCTGPQSSTRRRGGVCTHMIQEQIRCVPYAKIWKACGTCIFERFA